jgi:hypothetical protein
MAIGIQQDKGLAPGAIVRQKLGVHHKAYKPMITKRVLAPWHSRAWFSTGPLL